LCGCPALPIHGDGGVLVPREKWLDLRCGAWCAQLVFVLEVVVVVGLKLWWNWVCGGIEVVAGLKMWWYWSCGEIEVVVGLKLWWDWSCGGIEVVAGLKMWWYWSCGGIEVVVGSKLWWYWRYSGMEVVWRCGGIEDVELVVVIKLVGWDSLPRASIDNFKIVIAFDASIPIKVVMVSSAFSMCARSVSVCEMPKRIQCTYARHPETAVILPQYPAAKDGKFLLWQMVSEKTESDPLSRKSYWNTFS
jgi:hypothetical protein